MFIVSLRGGALIPCDTLEQVEQICDVYIFQDPVVLNALSGKPVSVSFNLPCTDSEY